VKVMLSPAFCGQVADEADEVRVVAQAAQRVGQAGTRQLVPIVPKGSLSEAQVRQPADRRRLGAYSPASRAGPLPPALCCRSPILSARDAHATAAAGSLTALGVSKVEVLAEVSSEFRAQYAQRKEMLLEAPPQPPAPLRCASSSCVHTPRGACACEE
jgi:hypothetical protein